LSRATQRAVANRRQRTPALDTSPLEAAGFTAAPGPCKLGCPALLSRGRGGAERRALPGRVLRCRCPRPPVPRRVPSQPRAPVCRGGAVPHPSPPETNFARSPYLFRGLAAAQPAASAAHPLLGAPGGGGGPNSRAPQRALRSGPRCPLRARRLGRPARP
jgi:hypothetical protein